MEDKFQLRNFVFTWNNPGKALVNEMTHNVEQELLSEKESYEDACVRTSKKYIENLFETQQLPIQYIIYGVERGEKNTLHFQGYCELKRRIHFSRVKNYFDGCHLELRMGSQQQAIDYCRKGGEYITHGTPKIQGGRTDLQHIKSMLESTRSIKTLIDENVISTYQGLRVAQELLQYIDTPRNSKPNVIWLWGLSGVGKTRLARRAMPNAYFKDSGSGKWWPNYNGETQIIIDDLRSDIYPFVYMLGLLDRYPFRIEGKGTTFEFQGTEIIITCPLPPDDAYNTTYEDIKQLLRRITQIRHMRK